MRLTVCSFTNGPAAFVAAQLGLWGGVAETGSRDGTCTPTPTTTSRGGRGT